MASHIIPACITLMLITGCRPKIIRNNDLMSKMVDRFSDYNPTENHRHHIHKHQRYEKTLTIPSALSGDQLNKNKKSTRQMKQQKTRPAAEEIRSAVMRVVQNVLCKNFPTIPCQMIAEDKTLKALIEKSLLEISARSPEVWPPTRDHNSVQFNDKIKKSIIPMVNSEDLSSILAVSNTDYYAKKRPFNKKWSRSMSRDRFKQTWHRQEDSGTERKQNERKKIVPQKKNKMRTFYPHKIKFKGKNVYRDNSNENSLSAELPKFEVEDRKDNLESPQWRIDYTKHGVPRYGGYGDDDSFDKVMGRNGIREQARKEVIHPDLFINSFVRKNPNENSEGGYH